MPSSFPAIVKSLVKQLSPRDYPVLNSRLFFEIWLNFILDQSLTSMRDLFYRLNHAGISVDISTFSKACKSRQCLNHKEFSQHEVFGKAVGTDCYFARPYHSWERGLNEHTNGLIRQFFPKCTNFRIIKPEQVTQVMDLINDHPRKSLGYQTPREVFYGQSGTVGLQT